MKLLNKGINYNLPPVRKNKLIYEVVEAEVAIKTISNPHLQNEARVLINNKFNRAIKLNNNLPPVSYTHLDVYKRQVQFFISSNSNSIYPN